MKKRFVYCCFLVYALINIASCSHPSAQTPPSNPSNRLSLLNEATFGEEFDFSNYDYIVDAIDTVSSKILLVEKSKEYNIPIICSMGAGNKLEPTLFEVADIYKTSVCPLAKVMRQELKKRKISDVKVVYSKEIPQKSSLIDEKTGKSIPGSISFVPSVVGLIIAGEVIKDLTK